MGYRRILVHLTAGKDDAKRIEAGLALAHRFGAHLHGLCVLEEPEMPAAVQGRGGSRAYLVEAAERQRERTSVVEEEFRRRCEVDRIPCRWTLQAGETLQTLADHTFFADLAIVSQQPSHGLDDLLSPDRADYLPLLAAGPVLILPREGRSDVTARKIVIAWKPVRSCARAIREASAMLEGAETVTLLIVDPPQDEKNVGSCVAEYLASHGITARVETRESHGLDTAGDVILDAVQELSADLLVMGAHGQSRLTEFIFGGATRDVLRHAKIPVMMSH